MLRKTDFVHSSKQEPHRLRTRQILKEHPEVRNLIGKNKYTIFAIIGLVTFQVVLSWLVSAQSWWIVFGAAYLLGAFADHSLFVMIHECAHHLLFKSRAANRLAGILSNLPQIFPSSVSFERYHIKHHSFQGVHELDADLPNRWEAKLINNYFIGKVIWLLFYPLFQVFRISRLREIKPFDKWVALNWLAEIAFTAGIWYAFGPKAIVYLLASFFFSVGLHPLGARWIQEHYLTHDEEQETFSYYGVLNVVAFNVGYHNEHHDIMNIPGRFLPRYYKITKEFYEHLDSTRSWTRMFYDFITQSRLGADKRYVRTEQIRLEGLKMAESLKRNKELVS